MEETNELFEKFWKLYPRKVGKALALKKWLKLKPTTLDAEGVIYPSVREHCLLKQWQDKQYIPHASTWLNQKRFLDDISNEPKITEVKSERPNYKRNFERQHRD